MAFNKLLLLQKIREQEREQCLAAGPVVVRATCAVFFEASFFKSKSSLPSARTTYGAERAIVQISEELCTRLCPVYDSNVVNVCCAVLVLCNAFMCM